MEKIWVIPMKGKGHEVTARNIMLDNPMEDCRPLTTDSLDNVLLYEDDTDQYDKRRVCLRDQGELL